MTTDEHMRRVTITIDPTVHDMGKSLARAERRDFSSYIEWLLKQEAKKPANNPPKPAPTALEQTAENGSEVGQ